MGFVGVFRVASQLWMLREGTGLYCEHSSQMRGFTLGMDTMGRVQLVATCRNLIFSDQQYLSVLKIRPYFPQNSPIMVFSNLNDFLCPSGSPYFKSSSQPVPACAGTICHCKPDVLMLPVCKPAYFPLYSFSETDEPLFAVFFPSWKFFHETKCETDIQCG